MASASPQENPQTGDIAPKTIDQLAQKVNKEAAGTTENVDELMSDPDTALLAKALKEDKEGTRTKVEMVGIVPGDEEGFREWMDKYTTIFTDPGDMEDEETIREHWE